MAVVKKPGLDVGKGFIDMLRKVPSFSPQMGMKMLEIREKLLEEMPKHKLSEEDKLWCRGYAMSLQLVSQCAAVHQAVPIYTLKAFVDKANIAKTLDTIEESGKQGG